MVTEISAKEVRYDELIKEKEKQMVALIEDYARKGIYGEVGDEGFKKIEEEINELRDKQLEERRRKQLAEDYEQRVKDVDKIQIQLKSGIILEELL